MANSEHPFHAGKIKMFVGPMFARKTSSMIGKIERYMAVGKACLLVKHKKDIRFDNISGNTRSVMTHSGAKFESCEVVICERLNELELMHSDLTDVADVIAISEGQFYKDLASECWKMATAGKIVIVEGLSGDFNQRPFESINALYPMCESIIHMKAICGICKSNDAIFTQLNRASAAPSNNILIGGAESYQAVCRTCLNRK